MPDSRASRHRIMGRLTIRPGSGAAARRRGSSAAKAAKVWIVPAMPVPQQTVLSVLGRRSSPPLKKGEVDREAVGRGSRPPPPPPRGGPPPPPTRLAALRLADLPLSGGGEASVHRNQSLLTPAPLPPANSKRCPQ